jgi:hypothetical protein
MFSDFAACSVYVSREAPVVGSQNAVTRLMDGFNSWRTSSLFPLNVGDMMVKPVIFRSGCDNDDTNCAPTMSSLIATIGVWTLALLHSGASHALPGGVD